jgi:pimeloyl-ACP methyl ester carboxylesterase
MPKVPSICCLVLLSVAPVFGQTQAGQPAKDAQPAQSEMLSRDKAMGIIADSRRVVSSNGIDSLSVVPINGTVQWLSVRGRDKRNPILLLLHGGPGSPTMPTDYTFQSPWEDYFTVVEWDQRGAGKTYTANDPKAVGPTMSVEQMTSDAEVVVRYLQKTYGKKKIFLMGHSWGSVLGVRLAQTHPEWFYAYVGVGQVVNMRKSEHIGYEFAVAQAEEHHNELAEKQLAALAPYPGDVGGLTIERTGTQRKWLMYYGGLTYGRTDFKYDANAWELSPDYSEKDLGSFDAGSLFSLEHLLPELETVDFDAVMTFHCPVFLFEGRHDYAASHELAAQWFGKITAPKKELVWFENSAHMVMQEEPGRFLYYLVRDVRPLAASSGDVAPANEVVY